MYTLAPKEMQPASPHAVGTVVAVDEARRLIGAALRRIGVDAHAVQATADHLLEAELRDRGGLQRLFGFAEIAIRHGLPHGAPPRIVDESDTTAIVDGGGSIGFPAAATATDLAIAKALRCGIAVVGANNHRYSGVLGLYVEQAARAGVVAIAAGSGTLAVTAPYGAREARLCTNPIAMGFPSSGGAIVWDAATAAVAGTELARLAEEGLPLPEGVAVDADGRPTRDARDALAGAVLAWGGHRGSGLAIAVQLLGLLCGLGDVGDGPGEWEASFLMIAIDPGALHSRSGFRDAVADFGDTVRATPPRPGFDGVRMPSDRSMAALHERRRDGIALSQDDAARLFDLAGRA